MVSKKNNLLFKPLFQTCPPAPFMELRHTCLFMYTHTGKDRIWFRKNIYILGGGNNLDNNLEAIRQNRRVNFRDVLQNVQRHMRTDPQQELHKKSMMSCTSWFSQVMGYMVTCYIAVWKHQFTFCRFKNEASATLQEKTNLGLKDINVQHHTVKLIRDFKKND